MKKSLLNLNAVPPKREDAIQEKIPDFVRDRATLDEFANARQRFERKKSDQGELEIRKDFRARLEPIVAELQSLAILGQEQAQATRIAVERYRALLPGRVVSGRVRRPSFWEQITTFTMAGSRFQEADRSLKQLDDMATKRRALEHAEEELHSNLRLALSRHAEEMKAMKAAAEPPAGFLAEPAAAALHEEVLAIKAERKSYQERLAGGGVSDREQRLRSLAGRELRLMGVPIDAALLIDIEAWGSLAHFIVLDIKGKQSWIPYDRRLEPLMSIPFRAFRLGDTIEFSPVMQASGNPLEAMLFLTEAYGDGTRSRDEFRRLRALVLRDRDLPPLPPETDEESALMENLARFCSTL